MLCGKSLLASMSLALLACGHAGCERQSPAPASSVAGEPSGDAAAALLRAHGWSPKGPPADIPFHVPADPMSNIPSLHYGVASREAGLDLGVASDRTVALRRYALGATRSGYTLYGYVALLDGRVVGAWLACDGPLAPGIAPITSRGPLAW